jgi:hypothetical protein
LKQFIRFLLISTALAAVASADVGLTVCASMAPNRWGSSSYDGYAANALAALESGGCGSVGDPSQPTDYSSVSQINGDENVVTGFSSWLGNADPTGAFASELGNRVTFGLLVDGNGLQVSAGNVSFTMASTDPGNSLGYTETIADLGSGSNLVYGTSGTANTPVLFGYTGTAWVQVTDPNATYNELAFVGMGNAPAAYLSSPGATNQDKIFGAAITGPYAITGTYTYLDATASATVNVVAPEPTALVLLLTMFAGAWAFGRKRFA